ncbi:MAG: 1-deoxy-D-xylulose-5-phosphate synthase, partial [Syntrophales bacterium LBB04]|nr:1-deoxy-D-xylulose-5-phosphate synthase [Syntrophales bacterium LBB04]
LLAEMAGKYSIIITVEENVLMGGIGSAVLEMLEKNGIYDVSVKRLGVKDEFVEHASQAELRRMYGIDDEGIMETVLAMAGKGERV